MEGSCFQDVDSSKMFQELASTLYDRATSGVLSKSMLLHLAHAEFEEQMMRNDRVHQIYKKYLDMEDIDPTLVSILLVARQGCLVNVADLHVPDLP